MKCTDCPLKYARNTGRIFHTRYKEHVRAVRNNNSNSGYPNHILNTWDTYRIINNTLDIIKEEREREKKKNH
jgi:hypothetical protein